MKKKVLLLIICTVLILSMLISCAKTEEDGAEVSQETTQKNSTDEQNENTTVAEEEDVEVPVITAFWRDTINPPGDSRITQYLEEKIGIDFETIDVPISEYGTKLNMAIASGELPDIFQSFGPDNSTVYQMLEEELILPLDEYLADYPNVQKYVNQEYHHLFAYIGEECIGIPREYGFFSAGMYYRKDLLDKYNLEIPITVEDYYNAMSIISQEEGIYGLTSVSEMWGLQSFLGAFNDLGRGGWVLNDEGKYVSIFVHPGTRQALEYLHKLYEEKILDPEFMLIGDFDQYLEKFYTGKVASIFAHVESQDYYNRIMTLTVEQMPEAEVVCYYTVEGPMGTRTSPGLPFSTVLHINAKTKHADKILEMFDYLLSDEGEEFLIYGIEGTHYTKDSSGNITVNREEVAKDVTDVALDPLNKFRWYSRILPGIFPEDAIDREWQIDIFEHNQENGTYSPVIGYFSDNLTRYSPEYKKIRNQSILKYITGELSFEESWDETIQEFMDAGYTIVEAEVNEYMKNK